MYQEVSDTPTTLIRRYIYMFYQKLALQNIKKNGQFYLPYILASVFTVSMFFMMINFTFNDSLENSSGGDNAIIIMNLGSIVIGIFSVIFLFYSNSFLIKRRKKEFGLYNILGMEKRHISRIVLFETIFVYLIDVVCGISFGTLFFKVLHLILMKLMHSDIPLGFEFHIQPVIITLVVFGVISLLIYLNCIRQVYISNPIELLRGGQVGEKEPKSKWILATFGVVFLSIGYYLALSVENGYDALTLFFIAVICVIIGTYLLFTTGSIVVLKSLKKNKKFYYKINHFTAVSGMIYRMKQNAIGLGNIAILSTMTIVTVAGSVSLYFGVDDILNSRYPNDISIEYGNLQNAPTREDLYNTIQDTLNEQNITMADFSQYNILDITVVTKDNGISIENPDTSQIQDTMEYLPNNVAIMSMLTIDDFNSLTNENYSLKDNEILMYAKGYNIPNTFNIDDTQYSVKPLNIDDFPINTGYYNMTKVSEIYVIFKDMSYINDIYLKQLDIYEVPSEIKYTVKFNLNGSNEEKLAFAKDLMEKIKIPYKDFFISPVHCKIEKIQQFYELYGSLLFLGIFLGVTFLMATGLIIYYKQLSEGYDDKQRFNIMQKVGLSKDEVKKTIHTQILMVFFLPLVTAIIHTAFAFHMIKLLLECFALYNVKLFLICTSLVVIIFGAIYTLTYSITAKVYFKITME